MIGQTISHYKILDKLGEGGMGVVYKAHDTKLDRTVALKFLSPQLTFSQQEKQRFIQEAMTASALDHPNICTIHEIDETPDGNLFIVMTAYEGITLSERIKRGPLTIDELLNVAVKIAEGLQSAHEKGIYHRDIKSSNIFITQKGQIKIMDFGLAYKSDKNQITKTGTTIGTIPYISPEQARSEKIDHRTDIWSLGVILYEMITGQLPFDSNYPEAMVFKILREEPKPVTELRTNVPPELERIIEKALRKDRDERYQNVDDMLADLKSLLKHRGLEGIRTAAPKSTHTLRRYLYGLPVFSVALIFILALYVYFFHFPAPPVTTVSRSIAVLPFENLSPDPDDAYFADGVHEDIIIQLSMIEGLQVIARSSVLRYPVGDRNLSLIGSELGVTAVMEGTIRRLGEEIRVFVQLIDVENLRTLWTEVFERSIADLYAVQSEIAREVASALQVSITPDEQQLIDQLPTENMEAYDLYLRARSYLERPGYKDANYHIAENFLNRAIELDPDFAYAYAYLSLVHSQMYGLGKDRIPERLEKIKQAAQRAFELQPELPVALNAMSNYYYRTHNYERALEYITEAGRKMPNNSGILFSKAIVQRRMGLLEQSIENMEKSIELNPFSANTHYQLGISYQWMREYQKAEEMYNRSLQLAPDFQEVRNSNVELHISWRGDIDYVQQHFIDFPEDQVNYRYGWLNLKFYMRDYSEMLRLAMDSKDEVFSHQLYIVPKTYMIGLAYHYLGNEELAHEYFELSLRYLLVRLQTTPDDPRLHASLGMTYALLGMHEQAVETAHIVLELMPVERDYLAGTRFLIDVAAIYAHTDKVERAIELLDKVLSIPSPLSIYRLKVEPIWDPLREYSEFQMLMEKHG